MYISGALVQKHQRRGSKRTGKFGMSTNVTDGQTDRLTTCDGKTALFTIVHRAVKSNCVAKSKKRQGR